MRELKPFLVSPKVARNWAHGGVNSFDRASTYLVIGKCKLFYSTVMYFTEVHCNVLRYCNVVVR